MSIEPDIAPPLHMNTDPIDEAGFAAQQATQENIRLVAAIGNGDREAERLFVTRFQPRVRAMLLARARNADVASDLQQDVIIEAICALRRGQLRDAAKLPAFVIAIARNLLNSHYRSASRVADSLEFPDDLPDLRNDAAAVEDQQRESIAMEAISCLDRIDKSILQLTLVEGLKPGVIAERLRMSPDVVRQRKLRATRRVVDFVRRGSQKGSSIHIFAGHKP